MLSVSEQLNFCECKRQNVRPTNLQDGYGGPRFRATREIQTLHKLHKFFTEIDLCILYSCSAELFLIFFARGRCAGLSPWCSPFTRQINPRLRRTKENPICQEGKSCNIFFWQRDLKSISYWLIICPLNSGFDAPSAINFWIFFSLRVCFWLFNCPKSQEDPSLKVETYVTNLSVVWGLL